MMVSLLVLLVLSQIPLLITSQCTNFQYTVQPPTELPCNPFNGNKWKLRTICTVETLSGSQSFEIHWLQRDKNGVVTDLGKPEFYTSGQNRKEVYYGLHLNDKNFAESMLGTYWCQVINTSQQPNVYLGTSNNFTILRPNEYDNGLSACLHTTTVSISETKCADDPPPPMTSTTLPLPTTLSTLASNMSPPLSSSIATASSMSLFSSIKTSLYLPTSSTMDSPQLSSMFTAITLSSSSSPITEISSLISKTTILSISSSHFSIQSNSLVSSTERHATSTSDNTAFVVITTTNTIQRKTAVVRSTSTVISITPTQSVTHSTIQIIESPSQEEQQPEPQPFLIYIVMIVITVSVVVIIVVISLVIVLIVLLKKPKLRDLPLTNQTSRVNLAKDRDSMYINPTYSAVNVITTIQDSDKNSYQSLITRGLDYANVYTSIKGRNTTRQNEERKTYVNVNSNIIQH